jgi:hypothetical protein
MDPLMCGYDCREESRPSHSKVRKKSWASGEIWYPRIYAFEGNRMGLILRRRIQNLKPIFLKQ